VSVQGTYPDRSSIENDPRVRLGGSMGGLREFGEYTQVVAVLGVASRCFGRPVRSLMAVRTELWRFRD
jgi:hypothetical protein